MRTSKVVTFLYVLKTYLWYTALLSFDIFFDFTPKNEENTCHICHFCHMCVTKVQNNNGNKFRGKIAKLPITLDAIAIEIDI